MKTVFVRLFKGVEADDSPISISLNGFLLLLHKFLLQLQLLLRSRGKKVIITMLKKVTSVYKTVSVESEAQVPAPIPASSEISREEGQNHNVKKGKLTTFRNSEKEDKRQ